MLGILGRVVVLASLLALACSSDNATLERRGGPLPDDGSSGGAGDSGAPVAFCDVLAILRAKCQRCHSDPPAHGAPVPFLTYENTQAPYYDTTMKFSDVMLPAIQKGFMPYVALNDPPTSLMPPVEPLTSDEKATMIAWLKQGALPTGGTDCP